MLHHLTGGLHGLVPCFEYVREALAVLRHPAEHLQGDLGEHAECTLRAHHDLIEVGATGLAAVVAGLDSADGGGILLRQHDIGNAAVVGAVLTCASRDRPAADGGVFKRLREVAAGVLALCAEKLRCVLQSLFKVGAGHARLNGYGLVYFIKRNDLVESPAHIERNTALNRLNATGDGAAAAVDIQGNVVLGRVCDYLLDLLGGVGIKDNIGNRVDDLMAQTQNVIGREAVCNGQSVVIGGGDALIADYLTQSVNVLLRKLHRVVGKIDLIKADIVGVLLEVVVGELEDLLHHLVQRFLGVFEKLGVAPAEDGAVAVSRCGGVYPLGLEALIRFVTH